MHHTELETSVDIAKELGLSEEEFLQIENVLGRKPNSTELRVISMLWSEPCSFKHAYKWLGTLNNAGNGGMMNDQAEEESWIEIDRDLGCIFSMKACNSQSGVSSPQSAGEGTADMYRRIIARGARPVAALNSLRFGDPATGPNRDTIRATVSGVSENSRKMGVPMVGGEVAFHSGYQSNCLVNLLAIGLTQRSKMIGPHAGSPGNDVYLAGPTTFLPKTASTDRTSDSYSDKILMEAVLAAAEAGMLVGLQNITTGGMAQALSQICVGSGTGIQLYLGDLLQDSEKVPPETILLSAHPGRMVFVAKKESEGAIRAIFEKWEVACTKIGEVTDSGMMECFYLSEKKLSLPMAMLMRGVGTPVYEAPTSKPRYLNEVRRFNLNRVKTPSNIVETAKKLFASPNLSSKRWLFEQFDSMVRNNNMGTNAPADAAVIRVEGSDKLLALSVDGNASYTTADPYVGGMIAVAEAARNITCSGGVPTAISYCFNFGSPHHPESYYLFVNAIRGVGEACRKFNVPVLPGDVSFERISDTDQKVDPFPPTPVIGMLGVIDDPELHTSYLFKEDGDLIYMLGNLSNDLGSSAYLHSVLEVKYSPPPEFDLYEEFEMQKHIRKLIRKKIVRSAHDVSDGGLFTNLMESAIASDKGFNVETVDTFRKDCFLFGEGQSRIVITIAPEHEDTLQNYLINNNVSFSKLGEVFGDVAIIDEENFGSISIWKRIFEDTLPGKIAAASAAS